MQFLSFCYDLVFLINSYIAIPAIIIFLSVAITLTLKLKFPQFRAFPKFKKIITGNISEIKSQDTKTISPFAALFTSMATTIGVGNIVGPSMAIAIGGPGALFWLLVYIFFGSILKFVEVSFSVYARKISDSGDILGGPAQYLKLITPALGNWYAFLTIFLFTIWSSIQVNTIACICSAENIPNWLSGALAVAILLIVVLGGVKRIGHFASTLVPIKFLLYVTFATIIIFKNIANLPESIKLVFDSAFSLKAIMGSSLGIAMLVALKEGIYKAIFITESGIGTGSIAHALSNVKKPSDQGILAMYSAMADFLLCTLSGLLTLVTGVWKTNKLSNTLIYEAFKSNSPIYGGQIILIFAVFLFVVTALIGNTYNGSQSFGAFTKNKYIKSYYIIAALFAFSGALIEMPFLWNLMDIVLVLVAIPNIFGILYLAYKHSHVLDFNN